MLADNPRTPIHSIRTPLVRVAVFIVYHFVLFWTPDTQNNLLFLNTKP